MNETIYALASGIGRAGVAIFRLSGPEAGPTLTSLTGADLPPPRVAVRIKIADPESGEQIDDGLALWFPAPRSFTGEDVAELHLHGGTATRERVLVLLGNQSGLRLAMPGEFTRRAVLAGKMDLTAAEGLIDLIDAETEAQRRQALRQSQGALGRLYDSWRDRLLPSLAHLEAAIDFPDEDLPADLDSASAIQLAEVMDEISDHLRDNFRGERLRDGLKITIVGPPNVGKSSLLNWLAQKDAAIVSAGAGTTRDVIEVHMNMDGYPVVLADTAGIRSTASTVEAIGVERAFERAQTSDLKIAVLAADDLGALSQMEEIIDSETICVLNKIDLANECESAADIFPQGVDSYDISVKTEVGLEALIGGISKAVANQIGGGDAPAITRQRHREALQSCRDALERGVAQKDVELRAEDMRLAVRSLGNITGLVDVEDLLDVIFRDFCIGK
ncbi:MAG TPA: tRNA uridine-5-carboxymethylaminomethyl(34) synthesis GTPase MnmE [Rhodospirillaceae bacterium]|nr:tRNA uridine-5-carboxymethylaminomethyl(34) synthesis GTPase MnmE [Rhodospirillaceae bacterium]HAT36750.1 tRNA uridine-5-carboxymethylaminomethyl(34) synthesis GTPase MnmE [Rhodospirillaceae bacterium]